MTYSGQLQNGVVVFDTPPPLPNGTAVEVTVRESPEQPPAAGPTHLDLFRDVVGQAVGLPDDYALNHARYTRGAGPS